MCLGWFGDHSIHHPFKLYGPRSLYITNLLLVCVQETSSHELLACLLNCLMLPLHTLIQVMFFSSNKDVSQRVAQQCSVC